MRVVAALPDRNASKRHDHAFAKSAFEGFAAPKEGLMMHAKRHGCCLTAVNNRADLLSRPSQPLGKAKKGSILPQTAS